MKNLLTTKDHLHKDLYKWYFKDYPPILVLKEEYTVQDLWEYFHSNYVGYAVNPPPEVLKNRFAHEVWKRKFIQDNTPEIDEDSQTILEKLVDKNGLDIVLFAIDLIPTEDDMPTVSEINRFILQAKGLISRMNFENRGEARLH